MTSSAERELLTQTAARQLLERAGQIDSDSTSVDALRAAAREAGISEAAFDAALVEMRGKMSNEKKPASRAKKAAGLAISAAAMLIASFLFVIPNAVGSAPPAMVDHEIAVKCLPMKMAQDIAQTQLTSPGNEVELSPGSRTLRVRATAPQVTSLELAFESAAKTQPSCDNTPVGP